MIPQRLAALRREMKKHNISVYVVPTSDFHESEYVGAYFMARTYITGFTGSAGTAVITMTEAGLWTDGRYFVQAARQLKGTTITLYRMGEEGVPTVNEYIEKNLMEGEKIGFDGRVVNAHWGEELEEIAAKKKAFVSAENDLVDAIWEDRPPMAKEPAWILDEAYSGRDTGDKCADVRRIMKEKGVDTYILSSLSDIAWLLNVRGNDISYVPVVLSYILLTEKECIWFVQEEILDATMQEYLHANQIQTMPYDSFYAYVAMMEHKSILLNPTVINYRTRKSISSSNKIIEVADPTEKLKAVKNKTEIGHIKDAHVKDAVAMCKFMYWLKKNVGKIPMTEISVADYLADLRGQQEGFLDLSFETIAGYAEHGAIVHYAATEETDVPLKPEGFLLVDSGGHYLEGTTDITRTFALGPLTDEMKANYTRVCRSNMNLANVRFLYGCSGRNLDIVAREPLWEAGLDYKHGTGHGVGYTLSVHEGPNAFRWKKSPVSEECILEEGMVTTDEPGIYIEGQYGIRLENELVCCKDEKNSYGQFMHFENITYVPFDLDAVVPQQMTETERARLNAYHKKVYTVVSPYLLGDELEWLKEATREI